MNIFVVDYSGHPFQIQLSKELARNGINVKHIYCSSFVTPKGNVEDSDIPNYSIVPIQLSRQVNKTDFLKRRAADVEFGRLLKAKIIEERPDHVVLSNLPMDSIRIVSKQCKRMRIPYIFWLQDIYHVAMNDVLKRKLPFIGRLPYHYYAYNEKKALRNASHIVAITPDFKALLGQWGINEEKISVIPNWAPIDELPLISKNNEWAKKHSLERKKVILYSGTLGYKHNPDILITIAQRFKDDEVVRLVIISEGEVIDYIKQKASSLNLNNILFLPFQPFSEIPNILGASDFLVAILEKEAGIFSVPSKVLTYLSAGKPIILSVPKENLASKIILENKAGLCFEPDHTIELTDGIRSLIDNLQLQSQLGKNARNYAEINFNIVNIAKKFELLLKAKE